MLRLLSLGLVLALVLGSPSGPRAHAGGGPGKLLQRLGQGVKKLGQIAAQGVRKATARLKATAKNLRGFAEKAREKVALASAVLRVAKLYPQKLAELRALRSRPSPIHTGFDPAAALSPKGLLALQAKARVYERITNEHLADHLLVKDAELDPDTGALVRVTGGLGDGAYHHGQYLAARAYQYGVTGDATDLAALKSAMLGAYNLMTIASAPAGRLVDPRTGAVMKPRAGLLVRGFYDEAGPLRGDAADDLAQPDFYRYEGTLPGVAGRSFVVIADVSRDQMDGLMMGLTAVAEVLTRRPAEPELRARLGQAAAVMMLDFVRAGYRIVDLSGRVTTFGDQSHVQEPSTLMQNLSWLQTTYALSGSREVYAAYDQLARRQLGGLLGAVKRGVLGFAEGHVLAPLLGAHKELVQYFVKDFNYNLLVLQLHALIAFERDPKLRAAYVQYHDYFVRPLIEELRVPFFDFVTLVTTGRPDPALLGRAAAVLRQYRDPPAPFGNPASQTELMTDFTVRADLRDPLFIYLHDVWDRDLQRHFPKTENPFYKGGGIWPLGPGLVPRDNNLERANPYRLVGHDPYGRGWTRGKRNLIRFAGHDYLLSYWYARYHGLLDPNAVPVVAPSTAARAWYRGDLHVHTKHSGDGFDTVEQTLAMARRQKLDFIVLSDHDTLEQGKDPAARSTPGLEVAIGYEWTFKTHLGLIGATRVQSRPNEGPPAQWGADTQRVVDDAIAQGAAVVMNHPAYTQFPWVFDTQRAHAVEIWNSHFTLGDIGLKPISPKKIDERMRELGLTGDPPAAIARASRTPRFANDQAIAYWEELLGRGQRLAAVGGSDRHQIWLPGYPTTWVLAPSAKQADVIAAIRAGRTVVSEGPGGPFVSLEADADGDGQFERTLGDAVPAGRPISLRARVRGAAGGRLRLFQGVRLVRVVPITSDDFTSTQAATGLRGEWFRAEVLVPLIGGPGTGRAIAALSHPERVTGQDTSGWGFAVMSANRPVIDVGPGVRRVLNAKASAPGFAQGAITSPIYVE